MSYIDYRTVATVRNDDTADKFAAWLREQLQQLNPGSDGQGLSEEGGLKAALDRPVNGVMPASWGRRLFGRRKGLFVKQPIPPAVERLEPAPRTNTPRVMIRFIFDCDADLEFYNATAAPHIRSELNNLLKRWREEEAPDPNKPPVVIDPATGKAPTNSGQQPPTSKPSSDAPLPVTLSPPAAAGKAAPGVAAPPPTPPPPPPPPPDKPITLERSKEIRTRLPPLAWVIPIVVGAFIIFAMFYGSRAVQPTLNEQWPVERDEARRGEAFQELARQLFLPFGSALKQVAAPYVAALGGATSKPAPVAAGTTVPKPDVPPKADDKPKTKPNRTALFVDRQKYAIAWLASYVGFVGVLAMVTCLCFMQVRRGVDQVNLPAPVWQGFTVGRGSAWRHRHPMTFVNILLVALAILAAVIAVKLTVLAPDRLAMFREVLSVKTSFNLARLETIQHCNVRSVLFVTMTLALAYASLLLRQRRRDPQPLQTTIHIRLKSARSLLNAGSAALVCGVLHTGFLVQMALPSRAGEKGSEFAWNYAIAWGVMFTILLAGFYVPTVSALTGWGHRYVLLNCADDTQEVRVAKLAEYDTAFRAEFKPYLSLLATLAPAATAVVAKLIDTVANPAS